MSESPHPPPPLNPYAPSALEPSASDAPFEFRGGVSSLRVCVQAIGAIAICGGVFGLGLMGLSLLGGGAMGAPADPMGVTIAMLIGGIGGAMYAWVCASLVVPSVFLVGFHLRGKAYPWTAPRVRGLASSTGFLTGWLSVVVPSLPGSLTMVTGAPEMLLGMLAFGLIPGVIGLAGTLAMMEPLSFRAGQETQQRQSAESAAGSAPSRGRAAPLPGEASTN